MKFFHFLSVISISMITTTSGFAETKSPKVVVVGAGIAGLTAAYRLNQKGADVEVYEARSRVGGRIFSARLDDHIVELGAQNISDGGMAENVRRLIRELQLDVTENRVHLSHTYFDGTDLITESPRQTDPKTLREQIDRAAKNAKNLRDVLKALVPEENALYKSLSVRLAAYEGASPEKLSPLYAETLFHMILGGICAVHQGADEDAHFVDLLTIDGGNSLLPQRLAESLAQPVHFNMPLLAVSQAADGSYELSFQNGEKAKADILVLAIPCSVYADIVFEENLIPAERLEAIRSIQYGTNAKIMIPFAEAPSKRTTLISDKAVAFMGGSRVLTLYCTGEASKFTKQTISATYRQERPMLELAFGDVLPSFADPEHARDEFFASYEGAVGYSWPNDPYAKGSYSYIAAGQEALLTATQEEDRETVKSLFAPIDQRLYFAGEHATILTDVPGTLEAACESGERIARLIAKRLKK